jgi:hypothetical protein
MSISLVSFGQSFVLFGQILYLLLQEPDFLGVLLLKGVQFIPKRNIFHGLLTNPAVFFLQLAGYIFYYPEFVRLDSRSISQGLYDTKK